MIIKDVYSSHINTVINGYKETAKSNAGITGYGKKSDMYFSNVEISFEITGVKAFELRFLKDFASEIVILSDYIGRLTTSPLTPECLHGEGDYYKNKQDEVNALNQKLNGSYTAMAKMFEDTLQYPEELKLMMPLGAYQYDVIVRFKGMGILSILGVFPDMKLRNTKTKEFLDPDSKDFKSVMTTCFVMQFYNYAQSALEVVDVLTDVQMNNNFFNCFDIVNNKIAVLSHINTPFGGVSCINIDPDLYKRKMAGILGSMKSSVANGHNIDPLQNVDIYVACNMSLQSYIFFKTNSNLISYEDDLNTVVCEDSVISVPDDLPEEYKLVFIKNINQTDNFRKNALKVLKQEESEILKDIEKSKTERGYAFQSKKRKSTSYTKIELYEYIPSCTRINCMMKFTCPEIENLVLKKSSTEEINLIMKWLVKFSNGIKKAFTVS